MDSFFVLCLGLIVLTYSLSHLYRVIAIALHIVDKPDHRSAHTTVTPTGAGAVFVLLFCIGMLLSSYSGELGLHENVFITMLVPVLLLAVLGLADDYGQLPWSARAVFHLLIASWGVYLFGFPNLSIGSIELDLGLFGLVFGAVALTWFINLYNFMDGIDGIAAGEALFALISATTISIFVGDQPMSVPVLILASVLFGFLLINWPKAKVFMGDVGSGFLGLVLGLFMLSEVLVNVWCWMILFAWFVTDACLTISIRLVRGERIYEAHSLHAYQHLNRALGTGYTLFLIGGINMVWLLPLGIAAQVYPGFGLGLLVLAAAPLIIFQYYCGAGQLSPRVMTD